MPGFFCLKQAEISSTGSTAPISLFTYMIETRIVSSRTAASSSPMEIWPQASTGRYVTSNPCFSRKAMALYTDGCSMEEVIMCFPAL